MSMVKPRPYILDTFPYVAGADSIPGFENPVKLSSNESPLGPSPKAIRAYEKTAGGLARYPDSACSELRRALATYHKLAPERIICTNGSEQLIDMLARAYSGPGDEIIFTQYAFIAYRIAALANGATPVAAAETDFRADVDAILSKVTDNTRIVFIANPNNPTGTYLGKEQVYRLRESLPQHILLVIDAAYSEYVDKPDYSCGHELALEPDGNCVILHTFSKLYGLAALRIGWAVAAPEIIDVLNRINGVFNVSRPAQAAAIAGLQDPTHTNKAKRHNDKWRPWLTDKLEQSGLRVTPGLGNFLLVHFDDAVQSRAADAHLRRQGIIVRSVAGYGLPQCLRISVGLAHENRSLAAALHTFLAETG